MKKLLKIFLCLLVLIPLTACGGKQENVQYAEFNRAEYNAETNDYELEFIFRAEEDKAIAANADVTVHVIESDICSYNAEEIATLQFKVTKSDFKERAYWLGNQSIKAGLITIPLETLPIRADKYYSFKADFTVAGAAGGEYTFNLAFNAMAEKIEVKSNSLYQFTNENAVVDLLGTNYYTNNDGYLFGDLTICKVAGTRVIHIAFEVTNKATGEVVIRNDSNCICPDEYADGETVTLSYGIGQLEQNAEYNISIIQLD